MAFMIPGEREVGPYTLCPSKLQIPGFTSVAVEATLEKKDQTYQMTCCLIQAFAVIY